VAKRLPWEFLKKQCAIPIQMGDGQMAVALADPLNLEAYDAIVGVLGRACPRVLCPAPEIEQAISRCYYYAINTEEKYFSPDPPEGGEPVVESSVSTVQTHAEDLLSIAQKAPAIQLVNKILFQAVQSRASDIHIEPYENEVKIRFRVDGVLHNADFAQGIRPPPPAKVMANLNIAAPPAWFVDYLDRRVMDIPSP
jgi:type II secretory ATPase GspE/PulE/Tfp pilus assembly ATPase PilB-like protein